MRAGRPLDAQVPRAGSPQLSLGGLSGPGSRGGFGKMVLVATPQHWWEFPGPVVQNAAQGPRDTGKITLTQ